MKRCTTVLLAVSAALALTFPAGCSAQTQEQVMDIDGDCSDTSKRDEWLGKSWNETQTQLREPIEDETFELSEAVLSEFRIGLYKLKQSLASNEDVTVREVTWAAQGDCRLTLWFKERDGKQTVFDTLYWNRHMEF